jgi:Domain of Unknown Function (DUF1206)
VSTIELGARDAERKAKDGRGWYAVLARVGLVAKGISYGLVGALAIGVAAGAGGKTTSRQGALESLARHALGRIVLALLALGFAAYAAWRLVQAYAGDEWAKRLGYLGRGAVYAGLTWTTARILFGSGGGASQNEKAHHSTAKVLAWPGGTWIVGLAGVVLLGVACWNLYRGVARKFADKWRHGLTPAARRWGKRAGVAGHAARFVVFGLIGVFVVRAALDYDPKDAIGLDGALQKLAGASYGPWLLGLTAAGLIAYGIYCLVDARLRDVSV